MKTNSSKMASSVTNKFKSCGDLHTDDVQRHEDEVRTQRCVFWRQRWELHVEIGPDGERDGRRREDKFNQRSRAGEVASNRAEGGAGVGEGSACMRDGAGQFGKTEDERRIHGCDDAAM